MCNIPYCRALCLEEELLNGELLMKKPVIALIAVVVIVVVGGGIVLATHKSSNDMSPMDMSKTTTAGKDGAGAGTPEANSTSNQITIKNFAYSLSHTTVKVGTTVTWTNEDSAAHTVTTSNGPVMFDSGSIATGKSYSFTFTKAGDYKYFCSFHPSMTSATVTVIE
jgi:plastocyanin